MADRRRRNKHKSHSSLAQLSRRISNLREEPYRLVLDLKRAPDAALGMLYHSLLSSPHTHEYVEKGIAPPRYRDFPKLVVGTPILPLRNELAWAMTVLIAHKAEVNKFLATGRGFDRAILRGNLTEAATIVTKVAQDCGPSLWTLEARLLIATLEGGLEKKMSVLRDITHDAPATIRLAAQAISRRIDSDVSVIHSDNAIRRTLQLRDSPILKNFYRSLLFRTNFHSFAKFQPRDFSTVIAHDSFYSIIDRYLGLRRILQLLMCRRDARNHLPSEMIHRHFVAAFDDPSVTVLGCLWALPSAVERVRFEGGLLALHEAYTRGEYEEVIHASIARIADGSSNIDYYQLLVSSLTRARAFEPLDSLSGLQRQIVDAMYAASLGKSDGVQAVLRYAYNLDSTALGLGLWAYGMSHGPMRGPANPFRLIAIACRSPSPRLSYLIHDETTRGRYVEALRETKALPCAAALAEATVKADEAQLTRLRPVLPLERFNRHRGRILEMLNRPADAAAVYRDVITACSDIPSVRRETEESLFRALWSAGQKREAIEHFATSCLDERGGLMRADREELARLLEERPGSLDRGAITTPIVHWVLHRHSPRILGLPAVYASLADFLSAHGVSKPSELIEFDERTFEPRGALRFFLAEVCVPDAYDTSRVFKSTEDLESERIAICRTLKTLDPSRASAYDKEISELVKIAAVRRSVQEVEQRMIFVDTPGILRTLEPFVREDIIRWLQLGRFDPTLLKITMLTEGNDGPRVAIQYEDTQLFQKLFADLRARFLSSSVYGLDGYLSVRIRHGTLVGQVRSIFERATLVTKRDGHRYERNAKWEGILRAPGGQASDHVRMAFESFSRAVDDAIDYVRDQWIQIHSGEKPQGAFRYDFDDQELLAIQVRAAEATDCDEFVVMVFEELWRRTEINLEAIRARIETELIQALLAELNSLEEAIESNARYPTVQLRDAVAQTRVELTEEIKKVAGWFRRCIEAEMPDFKLSLAIETAIEILLPKEKRARPAILPDMRVDPLIRGWAFNGLVDVAKILLENAIRHGSVDSGVPPQVRVVGDGSIIAVQVTNQPFETRRRAEHAALAKELVMRAQKWKQQAGIRQEGGTGFTKLGKLLSHDLRRAQWDVDVQSSDRRWEVVVQMSVDGLAE